MKKLVGLACLSFMAANAMADGQVFYRYGRSKLSTSRGSEVFTDTNGAAGKNDDDTGKAIGAGLALKLMNCPLLEGNSLLGEILVDYNKFSNKYVANAAGVLAPSAAGGRSNVAVSELQVVVSPKYRFELGKVRPWIIPVGVAFLVNSPPSSTTNYLDVGLHHAVGVEYLVLKELSVGVDVRRTVGHGDGQYTAKFTSASAYLGINF